MEVQLEVEVEMEVVMEVEVPSGAPPLAPASRPPTFAVPAPSDSLTVPVAASPLARPGAAPQ